MCICAARFFLFIGNLSGAILSLFFAILGGLLTWNMEVIYTFLHHQLNLDSHHESAAQGLRAMLEILSSIGLVIFIFALIVMVVALLGLYACLSMKKPVINVYIILHGTLLSAEILVIIIFASSMSMLTNTIKDLLGWRLKLYVSYNSTDTNSMLFNVLMYNFECCGLDRGHDFGMAHSFQRDVIYNGERIYLEFPISCCKYDENVMPKGDCPKVFNKENSNMMTGCWPRVKNEVQHYVTAILLVAGGVIILQLVYEIFSFVLVCRTSEV